MASMSLQEERMGGRTMDKETEKLEKEVEALRLEVNDMKRLIGALLSIIMEDDGEEIDDIDMVAPTSFTALKDFRMLN